MGGTFYSGVLVFFHAKSGTTNNYQNVTSENDISNSNPFSRDSNYISKLSETCPRIEKKQVYIFDFQS